jgi:sulfite reductase (NADPH) hemoprotein beta-component
MPHAVITANRLTDGVAVWFGPDEKWVETFAHATVYDDKTAQAALAAAKATIARQEVVGVYEFPVTLRDGHAVPPNVRETIRARGPSVRPDLGLQAIGAGV